MLLADPLSRLCASGDEFYDISLPGKVGVLLQNLPQQVAECSAMRVPVNKDTAAVAHTHGAEMEEAHQPYQSREAELISGT